MEAVVLALAVAFLVVHGLWVTLSQRHLVQRERLARQALTDFVLQLPAKLAQAEGGAPLRAVEGGRS